MPDPRLPTPSPPPTPLTAARWRADPAMTDRRDDDRVRQELLTHLAYLREDVKNGFAGVYARLDLQNGRVNGLEKRESAHHERIGALETAAQTAAEIARTNGDHPYQSRKRTAVTLSLGAGGGALLIHLIDLVKKALGS